MSALLAQVPEATVAERPTLAGERALRQVLGYIDRADASGTRRVYVADWRHYPPGASAQASCRYPPPRRRSPATSPRMPRSTSWPPLAAGQAGSLTSTTMSQDAYAVTFGQQGLMAALTLEGQKISPIKPE
ncbi:lipid-binding SYLF domain-containing protein [Belnapia rosea]|uniref:hypothetical protein n=1 Tax=Belnapia rosea TaxID=938405 RepID=UPI00087FA080|nr:hypothetical protein [Belnapia rosea]SDB74911.1 hypothetical protein SAMN02927895_05614 [Belnapia rosea]